MLDVFVFAYKFGNIVRLNFAGKLFMVLTMHDVSSDKNT